MQFLSFRFSRFVLWCEAGVSNKDPKKIASYFVKALEQAGGKTLGFKGCFQWYLCTILEYQWVSAAKNYYSLKLDMHLSSVGFGSFIYHICRLTK